MEKELLWNVLGYVVSLVVYLVLKWRYEGREAVNREAIEQEISIQGKGLGELKKKAVQEFVSKLPTHIRIFVNETTIDAVVKELQPIFKRMKEGKNGDYKA
ncbi:hypothetical protein [Fusobacterium pseudoperiodonticum]|jgi:hypothetical protein|uniref:hypothetical protein n=1 Tax=Fusobacterium pseudoperiodonticum TaxID=2663009 RepID=UPI001CAC2636|nr:hypothetical protein [Fusobacterium pseudoperiodonticum]MBF1203748.1 hypothetical protein [Fusobacterium periodonticum]DAJ34929.1 MAG TPA: hypothetical protein [Caudoviricetes sp.]